MADWYVSELHPHSSDMVQMEHLLLQEGIHKDSHLDYSCGIFDKTHTLIATGSCFCNTLRCLAVSGEYRGNGLLNLIVSHLIRIQYDRGNTHIFLYTKTENTAFFQDLGFYPISTAAHKLVFMENRRNGFSSYLDALVNESPEEAIPDLQHKKIAAIVMNANPFTLGHQYLIQQAAAENDIVHLFGLSEDCSLIPYPVRKKLILEGCASFLNIYYHDSGPYIISNATFPSYFLKNEMEVIQEHALLDLDIFSKIAAKLHISVRYVGEEPYSQVTCIYNQIMKSQLPNHSINCIEIPRLKLHEKPVSASDVRLAIKNSDDSLLKALVPESTYQYFTSTEATLIREKIQSAKNVVHY